jgi:hypothetical protein
MADIVNSKDKERKFRRLADLSLYISKYADLWGESNRLYGWVDEYNLLRSSMSWELWQEYCGRMGYDPAHDGYDNLA